MGKEKYSPEAICKLISNLMTPLLYEGLSVRQSISLWVGWSVGWLRIFFFTAEILPLLTLALGPVTFTPLHIALLTLAPLSLTPLSLAPLSLAPLSLAPLALDPLAHPPVSLPFLSKPLK